MSARTRELAMRRRALVLRSARLRGDLAEDFDAAAQSVRAVDQVVAIGRRLTAKPVLIAGALALAVVMRRPVQAVAWAGKALMALSVARQVLGIVGAIRARAATAAQ